MHRRRNPPQTDPALPQRQRQKRNAGILRSAQNDGHFDTPPCRDAARAGMVGGCEESCVFFEFYCAGLGSAFFAMVVGLGFPKVGSALIPSPAGWLMLRRQPNGFDLPAARQPPTT